MKIPKQLFALLILIGILANCFNHWILASSYALNKEYISTVLCSNKNHPELHCEGKCFMDIKLKELEQKNKHEQDQLKRVIETVAPQHISLLANVYVLALENFSAYYLLKKPTKTVISIFQPPKQA
jgi:hypothetical protein